MSSPAVDPSDDFINVCYQDGANVPARKGDKSQEVAFNDEWFANASATYSAPQLFGARVLRKLYPNHSIVMTQDYNADLLSFPHAVVIPMPKTQLVTNAFFIPMARRLAEGPGILVELVEFGAFRLAWNNYDFILFTTRVPLPFGTATQHFILHEGPEEPARNLILAAGTFHNRLHKEIWVFNNGNWQKDSKLWVQVQTADWKDVILKDDFKRALQKDVYGFFSAEDMYKQLAIPWKRGLILYGPPGNGKTISLKAIMKSCDAKGYPPLYVRSFQSWKGEQAAMTDVFEKARELSPCVIVLEDLDSLINDHNRSFFLNELDGLEDNDGLLIIATTNHFESLDPGLSSRPSRFDRKYAFNDPDLEERILYVKYWQKKLENNDLIYFPDQLVAEVAKLTEHFSFAYIKEAFVSSLVIFADWEGKKPEFAAILKSQIEILKKELDRALVGLAKRAPVQAAVPHHKTAENRGVRALQDLFYLPKARQQPHTHVNSSPSYGDRASLDAPSSGVDEQPPRIFSTTRTPDTAGDGRDIGSPHFFDWPTPIRRDRAAQGTREVLAQGMWVRTSGTPPR